MGIWVVVSAVLAFAHASASDAPKGERAERKPTVVKSGSVTTFAYAPKDVSAARPAVVYLHGRCGEATNGCPYFAPGTEGFGWLVCPRATERCQDGGLSWSGSTSQKQAVIDGAIEAVATSYPGKVDTRTPGVLVGFSQGAYIAIDLLRERPGQFKGVLFIGAEIETTAQALNAAGVKRVVLAAGAYDGARPAMEQQAKNLAAQHFEARFVSLGTVGHTYVADRKGVLRVAMQWLEEQGDPPGEEE